MWTPKTHQHGGADGPPVVAPELWIYLRSHPQPQLVVTVFDGRRDRIPEMKDADPLSEHGNGLRIVTALSAESGTHPSRSRIGPWPALGKAVWSSLALPPTWPTTYTAMAPGQAARRLHALLAARGLTGVIRGDRAGVSLVSVRHGITV